MHESPGIERARPARPRQGTAPKVRAERGAILVQVAAMMLGLTALSAFIVDYGILWTARRQIQNAADAAAMAAAISLAFDAPGDQARARANALIAVAQNPVWGTAATMSVADITFPDCPAGSVGVGVRVCVRVQAFRNQQTPSTPLPTIFGGLVGVESQGVRATATAQVLFGSSTDCVKPFAIPDKWEEWRNNAGQAGWDPLDTFERYTPAGTLLTPPPLDLYVPPTGPGANGTGFSRGPAIGGDYGLQIRLRPSIPPLFEPIGAGYFVPVRIDVDAFGAADYLSAITSCDSTVISPGSVLEAERSPVTAETTQGVQTLIALDPGASWDSSLNGGLGGVSGGCMSATGTPCTVSPRIIAVPAFHPDLWDALPVGVPPLAVVSRVVGLFLERLEGTDVVGRLMVYPAAPRSTMTAEAVPSFVVSVALVR